MIRRAWSGRWSARAMSVLLRVADWISFLPR